MFPQLFSHNKPSSCGFLYPRNGVLKGSYSLKNESPNWAALRLTDGLEYMQVRRLHFRVPVYCMSNVCSFDSGNPLFVLSVFRAFGKDVVLMVKLQFS